jgi:hypothetical protein
LLTCCRHALAQVHDGSPTGSRRRGRRRARERARFAAPGPPACAPGRPRAQSLTGCRHALAQVHDGSAKRLRLGRLLEAHRHVCVLGPVGVGKTFVSSALGHLACRHGYNVTFLRADPGGRLIEVHLRVRRPAGPLVAPRRLRTAWLPPHHRAGRDERRHHRSPDDDEQPLTSHRFFHLRWRNGPSVAPAQPFRDSFHLRWRKRSRVVPRALAQPVHRFFTCAGAAAPPLRWRPVHRFFTCAGAAAPPLRWRNRSTASSLALAQVLRASRWRDRSTASPLALAQLLRLLRWRNRSTPSPLALAQPLHRFPTTCRRNVRGQSRRRARAEARTTARALAHSDACCDAPSETRPPLPREGLPRFDGAPPASAAIRGKRPALCSAPPRPAFRSVRALSCCDAT